MLSFLGFSSKSRYASGTQVEALHNTSGKWIPAVIKEDIGNGNYKIEFEGGELVNHFPGRSMRDMKPKPISSSSEKVSSPSASSKSGKRGFFGRKKSIKITVDEEEESQKADNLPTIVEPKPENSVMKQRVESPYQKLLREYNKKPKRQLDADELKYVKKASHCNSTNDYTLDIARCGLSEIHPRLLKAKEVRNLLARKNALTTLDDFLPWQQQIHQLDLAYNQLSLPTSFASLPQFTALEYLDLSGNQLVEFPAELQKCKLLKHLHLQRNCIEKIPIWLGQLKGLQTLNLAYNNITKISSSLDKLNCLYNLILDENPCMTKIQLFLEQYKEGKETVQNNAEEEMLMKEDEGSVKAGDVGEESSVVSLENTIAEEPALLETNSMLSLNPSEQFAKLSEANAPATKTKVKQLVVSDYVLSLLAKVSILSRYVR
jgi:hypothetical protein